MTIFTVLLVIFAAAFNFTAAIECDFKYETDNNSQPSTPSNPWERSRFKQRKTRSEDVFECEDPYDDFVEIRNFNVTSRVKPMGVGMRFGEDEYESASSDCVSNKRTIQPSSLNNIYNKLMKVVNNATFIQSIEIDECRNKNEPCANGVSEPSGKKLLCRQKYVTITLKASKDDNDDKIFDEQFYYPSNCICELVQRKRST